MDSFKASFASPRKLNSLKKALKTKKGKNSAVYVDFSKCKKKR